MTINHDSRHRHRHRHRHVYSVKKNTLKVHIKICSQILHITKGRCREGKPLLIFTPPKKS